MVNSLLHSLQQVDKEKTTKIVNLARNLVDTKKSIEELEAKIKELKEKERIISEEQIPKFLQEMGVDAIDRKSVV